MRFVTYTLGVMFALLCLVFIVAVQHEDREEFKRVCKDAGGIPVSNGKNLECIRKDRQ